MKDKPEHNWSAVRSSDFRNHTEAGTRFSGKHSTHDWETCRCFYFHESDTNGEINMNQWMDLAESAGRGGSNESGSACHFKLSWWWSFIADACRFPYQKTILRKKVKLNMIMNAKSGLCPENCGYCSQSSISKAPIESYRMVDKHILLKGQNAPMTWI